MYNDEDIQIDGTMSDYLIHKLTDEEEGKDFAVEYLRVGFLSSAVNTLFYMRRQAGLTQAQVAERLNTKQSAIARLESDSDGGISLRRYVEFALACGMVPHNITFAPLESTINYTIAQPEILYTQVNHQEWLKINSLPDSISVESENQVEENAETMNEGHQPQSDVVSSIERKAGGVSPDSSKVASPAATLQGDLSARAYFQPYLIPPLQLLPDRERTNTALGSQGKTSNLTSSKVS